MPVCRTSPGVCDVSLVLHVSLAPLYEGDTHGVLAWWRTAFVLLHTQALKVDEGPKTAPSVVLSCAERLVQPAHAADAQQAVRG